MNQGYCSIGKELKMKSRITESMKKLGKIQKSRPKWKRKSQTKALKTIIPTYNLSIKT
jgi:hypothetical protein